MKRVYSVYDYNERLQINLTNMVWVSVLLCIGIMVFPQKSGAESIIRNAEPIGINKYSIYINDTYPQDATILDQYFRQTANETCGGGYTILEQCYTSDQMIGVIECSGQNKKRTVPSTSIQPRVKELSSYTLEKKPSSSRELKESSSPHFGVGIWSSFLNWGIGPSIEVYPIKYFGVMGTIGTLFDYTSFSGRGLILFPSLVNIAGYPNRPYIGAGFTYIKGSDIDFWGKSLQQQGSGIEVYGGILHSASYLLKNLYIRGEVIYSTFDLHTKYKSETVSSGDLDTLDHKKFSFAIGLAYLF